MNPVMGHQWEALYQVAQVPDLAGTSPGRVAAATHLCCECAYAKALYGETRCRCTHPSAEYADGVLFAGVPACAAFTPRHRHARGAFLAGSGGAALLHGS